MSTELECEIELYDSDVVAIQKVVDKLNESRQRPTTVDGWRREIIERFEDAGFVVGVVLRQLEGVERPDGTVAETSNTYVYTTITISARCEPTGEFDHDRQMHEVKANIRGFDQPDATGPKHFHLGSTGGGMQQRASGLYAPSSN